MEKIKQAGSELLAELLTSKKFMVLLASLAATAAAKLGFNVPLETVQPYLDMVMVWLVGQGIADHGKSKAKEDRRGAKELGERLRDAMRAEAEARGFAAQPTEQPKGD